MTACSSATGDWFCEVRLYLKRVLKRIDVSSRSSSR